jgi:hypothetical protein
MKPRHAAALALVGWYLMVPPESHTTRPLSEWYHISSHDTASECEDDRVKLKDAYKRQNNQEKEKLMVFSECIEADDPRLAK